MQQTAIKKTFCTTREAAELLGVSVSTVQLWVGNGLLLAWKTAGGHRRVVRASVDSLLAADTSQPAAAEPVRAERRVAAHATDPGQTGPGIVPALDAVRPLRILVVEDDRSLLRLYETQMSRWPMAPRLTLVDNAVAGLLAMGREAPDLLVTDLRMEGLDGFNMLRVLRNTPATAQARIVIVTGLDAAEIRAHGGVAQDIEVLPKPIPFARLLALAEGICNAPGFNRRVFAAPAANALTLPTKPNGASHDTNPDR